MPSPELFQYLDCGLIAASTTAKLSARDGMALACMALGLIAQVLQRRLPSGLGPSLFVAGATLAGAIVVYDRYSFGLPASFLTILFASAVCLVCSCTGAATAMGEKSRRRDARHPPSDVFFTWSLLAGAVAASLMTYHLAVHTGQRLFSLIRIRGQSVHEGGFYAIIALFAAVLIWRASQRRPQQPAMMLMLGALGAWWSSLHFPPVRGGPADSWFVNWLPSWWSWVFQLTAGLTMLLLAAAVIQDRRYRLRIAAAWPDRLDDLVEPYSRWPGYIRVESVIAAAILVLGVYQIVLRVAPSTALFGAGAGVLLTAASVCLFMTYRRWSANTAGLGMALLTVAMVHGAAAITARLMPDSLSAQYAQRMPVLYNAILPALAIMVALWRWLARVWDQQLLDGIAWTTTGRMIPYARRTAFFVTAIAALIAFQMALWPQRNPSVDDDSTGRMICGVLALLMFALIAALSARQGGSPALASLSIVFVAATLVFVFVRLPSSAMRGWLVQYDAVVFSLAALPILGLAEALPKTNWRAFAVPLWFLALLFLPAAALAQLLGVTLPEAWVRPLTLAILGAVYGIAGSREHRRAFLVLSGVLLLAAATTLFRSYG